MKSTQFHSLRELHRKIVVLKHSLELNGPNEALFFNFPSLPSSSVVLLTKITSLPLLFPQTSFILFSTTRVTQKEEHFVAQTMVLSRCVQSYVEKSIKGKVSVLYSIGFK